MSLIFKMDNLGWLVNDRLTCIPGTTTFWHDLLNWFPSLQDKTNGYTDYNILADKIETEYNHIKNKPYYIIRNGSYFRPMNLQAKQISLIQDVISGSGFTNQCNIINGSDVVVFNSNYVYDKYKKYIDSRIIHRIIPLGVNFDFFKPMNNSHPEVLPNSVIFIGASTVYPKGFDVMRKIISEMKDVNFCLVMKDGFSLNNIDEECRNRVRVFNRVNMETVRLLINSCICGVCTSREETQHLSGLECGACNIPMIATSVGFYNDCQNDNEWGCISSEKDFPEKIRYVMKNIEKYSPREYLINKYSTDVSRESWVNLIKSL